MSYQTKAALSVVLVVAECIRDLGSVPSGHLYAQLMGHFTLQQYESVVGALVGAGVVRRDASHVLTWVGGAR